MFQLCSCLLPVVVSQNVHKSSTSHVNVQMYLHRVPSCLKLTDMTFVLISMFSKQFSLKVILIKVRTHQWWSKQLLILQLMDKLLAVMIYSLCQYMAVTQHCITECCCVWPDDITVGYCTWSDTWYSFRTPVYLICILKQNIVHGVTCHTVSEHQYISHVYWNKTFK